MKIAQTITQRQCSDFVRSSKPRKVRLNNVEGLTRNSISSKLHKLTVVLRIRLQARPVHVARYTCTFVYVVRVTHDHVVINGIRKLSAYACSAYQALSPPLKGPVDEVTCHLASYPGAWVGTRLLAT